MSNTKRFRITFHGINRTFTVAARDEAEAREMAAELEPVVRRERTLKDAIVEALTGPENE